jgi:DNA-binding NarL/FixJ family response regulator
VYHICGFDPAEGPATYQMIMDRIHPDDVERVDADMRRAIRDKCDCEGEHRLRLPDGSIIHIHYVGHLDATRLIVRDAPRTQVLVLTMHRSEELAHQVIRAGARGYVLKSDADRELVAAVDSLQRRQSFRSPSLGTPAPDGRGDAQEEEGAGNWGDLTPREREIVQLVAEGRSSKEVAALLGIRSVSQLVRYAVRNGLVQA